ncbi:TolC family protein [Desulfonema magnum]|uniref:Outer membrane efflux protein n=1 Tax=Desulfonema magnum TaxID=45655 RepID=A0A975GQB3_9BACT|nr:TolC family protein [Desulfonema magnum]QTA88768.1 Outer membrane efflux protein [Desulfonema magnum]
MKNSVNKNSRLLIIAACITALLLVSGSAWGISLAELQKKAIENRKVVEKYRANVRKGELDKKISESRFMPSADISYVATKLDEDTLAEESENSVFTGAITYNVFSGFRDKYNVEFADLLKQSKDYELEGVLQDIKYSVALRYLDIFGKQSRLKVAEDEYTLLKKRYKDAENRHSVGLIRKNELLKLKVELDDTQQSMKKAEAEFIKSVNRLEFETDSEVDDNILNFNEFNTVPEIKAFPFYESRMFEKRSEIKALEMVALAKEVGVKTAQSAYYPSVDVSGIYKRFEDGYILGTGDDNEDEIRLQLSVKMNLFDGFSKDNTVRKARWDMKSAGYDLYELRQHLRTDLKNLLLDYDVALKNLKVAESSISQAEENLRITDISFKEGVETAADVLDAIFYLSRAKYNFINARNGLFSDYYGLTRMTDDF